MENWRKVLADIDFKQKPDGTVEIGIFTPDNIPGNAPEDFLGENLGDEGENLGDELIAEGDPIEAPPEELPVEAKSSQSWKESLGSIETMTLDNIQPSDRQNTEDTLTELGLSYQFLQGNEAGASAVEIQLDPFNPNQRQELVYGLNAKNVHYAVANLNQDDYFLKVTGKKAVTKESKVVKKEEVTAKKSNCLCAASSKDSIKPKEASTEEVLTVGKGDNIPDNEFDEIELNKGIQVEMEHTSNENVAKEIAKDHLTEDPDYYKKLDSVMHHHGSKKDWKETLTKVGTSYEDFLNNYPEEIHEALYRLKKLARLVQKEQLDDDMINNMEIQLGNIYDELLVGRVIHWLYGGPHSFDTNEMGRIAIENMNRNGTEPKMLLSCIEDLWDGLARDGVEAKLKKKAWSLKDNPVPGNNVITNIDIENIPSGTMGKVIENNEGRVKVSFVFEDSHLDKDPNIPNEAEYNVEDLQILESPTSESSVKDTAAKIVQRYASMGKKEDLNKFSTLETTDVTQWTIKKKGSCELIGRECKEGAGIFIVKSDLIVDGLRIAKGSRDWREVINQAVWEAKLIKVAEFYDESFENDEFLDELAFTNGEVTVEMYLEDGSYHEGRVEGGELYGWGSKKYMSYLSPEEIANYLSQDYNGQWRRVAI